MFSMSDTKEKPYDPLIPNFFYRKKECYGCDLKRHRLFLKESHNFIELFCKDCTNKLLIE